MPEESGGEKTLPASPMKKRRAREKGNVFKSTDLNSAWTLLCALLVFRFGGGWIFEQMYLMAEHYFSHAAQITVTTDTIRIIAFKMMFWTGLMVSPVAIVMLIAGLSMNLVQVGFLYAPEAISPKFSKLNPFTGLSKFFSIRSFFELIKSLIKLATIGYVVYLTLRSRWDEVLLLCHLTPITMAKAMGDIMLLVWFRVVLIMLGLGLADYGFQRWQYEKELRMTHHEAREEMKELEGDPRIKQRVRQIQRQMAMQRMMGEVPKADVVVTNPTTYAVALRYDADEMNAPILTAKGARLTAEKIREIAVENDVPIIEKPELARALYRDVELNHPIPESLYRAVAEVLTFVYQIDRRVEKKREREAFMSTLHPISS